MIFKWCNVLNAYILDLLNTSVFIHKNWISSAAFGLTFEIPSYSYSIRFQSIIYRKPNTRLRKLRFGIFIRGPTIWNNFLGNKVNELETPCLCAPAGTAWLIRENVKFSYIFRGKTWEEFLQRGGIRETDRDDMKIHWGELTKTRFIQK